MGDIRVASFNIRNGRAFDGRNSWPFRRQTTADAIRSLDADIVGLQEVYGFQLRSLRKRLIDYTVVGERSRARHSWGERCPILIRRGVAEQLDVRTMWFGETSMVAGSRIKGAAFPRIATIARIRLNASEVVVANTHLDAHVDANRMISARQLVDWLDDSVPRIVLGDFNVTPESKVIEVFAASGLRQALPDDAPGTANRFKGQLDGPRIDHIMVSEHFEVLDGKVMHSPASSRLPSDHWPVVAELRQH